MQEMGIDASDISDIPAMSSASASSSAAAAAAAAAAAGTAAKHTQPAATKQPPQPQDSRSHAALSERSNSNTPSLQNAVVIDKKKGTLRMSGQIINPLLFSFVGLVKFFYNSLPFLLLERFLRFFDTEPLLTLFTATVYMKPPVPYLMVPSPTPYHLPFSFNTERLIHIVLCDLQGHARSSIFMLFESQYASYQ